MSSMSVKNLALPASMISISIKDQAKYVNQVKPFIENILNKEGGIFIIEYAWPTQDPDTALKFDDQLADALRYDKLKATESIRGGGLGSLPQPPRPGPIFLCSLQVSPISPRLVFAINS